MNRAIGEKWIVDLRAGPRQTKGVLFDGRGHCCLGRLCVLAGVESSEIDPDGDFTFLGERFLLPRRVREWAGIKYSSGLYARFGSLAEDNDSGKTFAEIADIIEAHIDEL